MNPSNILLGREVAYPQAYDPSLLFPISRAQARAELGVSDAALPFIGHDRWHAYELSWLDTRGKPQVATATFAIPADSPALIESKSLKLYLNSLNASRFDTAETVRSTIAADLSLVAGGRVDVAFGLPAFAAAAGVSIDALEIAIDDYGPPNAAHLALADEALVEKVLVEEVLVEEVLVEEVLVEEHLHSDLLKSNCPVTGQPDWATLHLHYRGPRIDRAGLLRYLVSFRDHAEFHEQCVERIFVDVLRHCRPLALSVEARYTRRGGLDINPWRATPGLRAPTAVREARQ
jgi:7-cyano-7-deazaguanine reductase